MNDFSDACAASVRAAWDGEAPVQWLPLELVPPRAEQALGRKLLLVPGSALEAMARRAFRDLSFRIRPTYARELASLAYDPATLPNDRFAALSLLENAIESAKGVFPLCQDTGTATVYGWKGENVLVDSPLSDHQVLASGADLAWKEGRLRNSQLVPLTGFKERNTGDNSPLACEVFAGNGSEYLLLFIAKGGGSSNKTVLFQETKRLLEPLAFEAFARQAINQIGVSACPPYRIVFVIGGQSPEQTTLAAKLAGTGALDALPPGPGATGGPYRDRALEATIVRLAAESGWGAQFGGRWMARDARVIWLPRHAASLPVVLAVSCAAHRQLYGRIDPEGYYLEHLADGNELAEIAAGTKASFGRPFAGTSLAGTSPAGTSLAGTSPAGTAAADPGIHFRRVNLDTLDPAELVAGEFVELWGTIILARDAAHARLATLIKEGKPLPGWTARPVFYAGPTETPEGEVVGSIGPTTSKRMDSYQEELLSRGAFAVSLGKGERTPACRQACARYGGAYLVTTGGAAATAARRYVSSMSVLDWPELGMEAVRQVTLTGLPAMVAVDSRGTDYYADLRASQRE
jgi:fumarate hydratase class I